MEKSIIAAISDNYAIGKDNSMPWHISEDLKYFKKTTSGCTVIMGRKTFLSIGRALPGRDNIVITRGAGSSFPEGVITAHSLEEAFSKAEAIGKHCFVIGGGEIYRQALPFVDSLYITHVHTSVSDADTFFPVFRKEDWMKVEDSGILEDSKSSLRFSFAVYRRR